MTDQPERRRGAEHSGQPYSCVRGRNPACEHEHGQRCQPAARGRAGRDGAGHHERARSADRPIGPGAGLAASPGSAVLR
jgi:hypothetical protein